MARRTNVVASLALSALLALGTLPAPAIAEMAEEVMGADPISATRPSSDPAPATAPTKDAGPAEAQMGEESAASQEDPAQPADPVSTQSVDPAQTDAADLAAQSTVASGTWGTCPWDLDSQGNLIVHPGTGVEPTQMTIEKSPWVDYKDQIKAVKFMQEGGNKVVLPQNSFALFAHLKNLESVDFSGADSSNITNLSYAFCGCTSLVTTEGLSALDVSKVEDMTGLFDYCTSLTSLSGISGWNCKNVRKMSFMFSHCTSLASLDGLSSWSFPNLKEMSWMFEGCSSLTSLEGISNWSFPGVAKLSEMFSDCSSLASLGPISSWDVSKVTDISAMFKGCSSLASLDPISKWNTSSITSMACLFYGCSSLASLGPISGWDTSNVGSMLSMFSGCSKLTTLDPISGWNTSNVTNMWDTFEGCSSLRSANLSGWKPTNLTIVDRVFVGCSQLVSIDISGWNTSNVTVTQGPGHPDPYLLNMFDGCTSLSRITVGAGYAMKDRGMFPDATGYDKWWSTKDSQWFTKDEIVSSRSGVADTYVFRAGFPDVVPGGWYEGMVSRAASLGLLGGYDNGCFGPEDPITRGQVAVVLWKMAKQPAAGAGARDFLDVKDEDYFRDAVRWASGAGVVSGYGGGNSFGPNDNVTREQFAAMLANYAQNVEHQTINGSAGDYAGKKDGGQGLVLGRQIPRLVLQERNPHRLGRQHPPARQRHPRPGREDGCSPPRHAGVGLGRGHSHSREGGPVAEQPLVTNDLSVS